jgi:hypothetical protein
MDSGDLAVKNHNNMIYCIIKGKQATVQHTHANNRGIITVFLNRGLSNTSARSFSTLEFESVEEFLLHEYGAQIINKYHLINQ